MTLLRRMVGVVSLVALAACGSDTAGKGRVAFVMSGNGGSVASATPGAGLSASAGSTSHRSCQPEEVFQAATVTFSSILARTLDGTLVDVTIALPVDVNMLSLVDGKEATLPDGFLPPGTYDQIVVVMTKVEVTLLNGTKVAIAPPGGGWTAIVPVAQPFTVTAGETTTITLNFRRDLSFGCGSGSWEFHPSFEGCHNKKG